MSNKKVYVIEKDGVRAQATEITLEGLERNGWTVVDDGTKEVAEPRDEQPTTTAQTPAPAEKQQRTVQQQPASPEIKE